MTALLFGFIHKDLTYAVILYVDDQGSREAEHHKPVTSSHSALALHVLIYGARIK